MAEHAPSHLGQTLLGLLFALVGVVLLGGTVLLTLERREFLARAEIADGIVSRLNAGGSHPEIAFTTGKGEKISYPQGGFIFGYETGQPVRVYYLPEQPADNPLIVDRGALWGTPVMLGAMGLFFTLVGSLKAIRPARSRCGSFT